MWDVVVRKCVGVVRKCVWWGGCEEVWGEVGAGGCEDVEGELEGSWGSETEL